MEDLITALMVDAFNDLANAMEAADAAVASERAYDHIMALCLAYCAWAPGHPTTFQLLYGNPIPGYHAPEEITIPLTRRPFLGIFRWSMRACQTGELVIPAEYPVVPPSMAEGIGAWRRSSGMKMPDELLALLMIGWPRIRGMVLLELFHHSQPLLVGDAGAFCRYEMNAFARYLELKNSSGS